MKKKFSLGRALIIAVLVVSVMVLLPTLLYFNERTLRMQYMHGIEREQQLLDSLYHAIDAGYEAHYLLARDSINAIDVSVVEQPYATALLKIAGFYNRTCEVREEVLSSATGKSMLSQLEGYSNQLYTKLQNLLLEVAGQYSDTQSR